MSKWEDDLKLVKESYPDLGEDFGSTIDGMILGSASVGMDLYDKMTLPKTFGSTSPADLYKGTGHIRTYPERFGEGLMERDTSGVYVIPSHGEEAIRDFYMSDDDGMAGPAVPPGSYPHYSKEPPGEAVFHDEDEWRRMVRETYRRPAPVAAAEVSPYIKTGFSGEDALDSTRTTESWRGELSDEEAARFMAERDLSGIGIISPPIRTDATDPGFVGKLKDMGSSSMPVYDGPRPPDPDFPIVEDLGDLMYGPISFDWKDPLSTIEGSAFPSWLGGEADAITRALEREYPSLGIPKTPVKAIFEDYMRRGGLSADTDSGFGDLLDHFILSEAPVGGFLWSAKEAITDDSRESYYDDHRDRAISEWKYEHPEGTIEEFSEAVRREPWRFPLRGDPEEGETIESPYFVEGEIGELPVKTDEGSVIPHERERLYGLGPDGISSVTPATISPTSAPVPEVLSPEERAAAKRAETVEVDPLAGYDAYADALEADKFLGRDYWAGYDKGSDPGKKYLHSGGEGYESLFPGATPWDFYGRGLVGEPLSSGRYIPSYHAEDYYKLPKETLEGIFSSLPARGTAALRRTSDVERVDMAGLLAAIGHKDLAAKAWTDEYWEPRTETYYGKTYTTTRPTDDLFAPEPVSDYYKDILADMDFKTSPHFGGPALSPEVLAEIAASVMPGSETTAGSIYT